MVEEVHCHGPRDLLRALLAKAFHLVPDGLASRTTKEAKSSIWCIFGVE
jgi:hypothetical protein